MRLTNIVMLSVAVYCAVSVVFAGADSIQELPIWSVSQGWGQLGINTAVVPPDGKTPRPIMLSGKTYQQGLGTHAPSQIVLDLWGEYETFEAAVGVQSGNHQGTVIFQVVVDGKKLFDSGVMTEKDEPKAVSLSMKDAHQLELIVKDAGDGLTGDVANWADVRFVSSAGKASGSWRNRDIFDIAPFGKIYTWDPAKVSYHPNRVGELKVEDIFHGTDVLQNSGGAYTVPSVENGEQCIGLQWYENRKLRGVIIEFAPESAIPDPGKSRVEWWIGESPWQGDWLKLSGEIEVSDNKWFIAVNHKDVKAATDQGARKNCLSDPSRVRWIFPASSKPVVLSGIKAFTASKYDNAKLVLHCESAKGNGRITLYNGKITRRASVDSSLEQNWDLSKPMDMELKYCITKAMPRSDRTILNVQLPTGNFGVAVEDVIENGGVYVPDYGFYITSADEPLSLKEYKETKIKGRQTVLEKVRQMPDQSFERAMEKVHRTIQNQGPVMLSLACDNVKYIVERHGKTWFSDVIGGRKTKEFGTFHFYPEFGFGKEVSFSRHLHGGWMPVPVHTFKEENIIYEQRTFVAPVSKQRTAAVNWLQNEPLFVSEFTIENTSSQKAPAKLSVSFRFSETEQAASKSTAEGMRVLGGDRLLAFADTASIRTLEVKKDNGFLIVQGDIPAHTKETFVVYIPGWNAAAEESTQFGDSAELLAGTEQYWEKILSPSMTVEIPSRLLQDLIVASQVHCMLAARNEKNGLLVSPWISSDRYGPLESEAQAVIHGMSLMGQEDFARRSLDFFINRYNKDGLLTTGYTLWGVGWHLWTLGDYYRIHRNSKWLSSVAPKLEQACNWIVREREKTKRIDPSGQKVMEYGLMPPGVFADWNRFAYLVRPQGEFYAGLLGMAESAADIGYPGGEVLIEKAAEFREELYRAYHWSQARSPVVKLSNGTWVPYSPTIIGAFGPVGEMFPGEDGNRAWGKDVSSGPHHLVPLGLLDDSREINWIANYLEDNWFLKAGMGEYPLEEVEQNWFDLGGFYKVQPYYGRIAELYAYNDDVKPFIRTYFNAIPTLISKENLSFWEHFHNTGGWNKTHETGWFLAQTRMMFVMERNNDQLWLAPFVTNHWMKEGMTVAVQNAQTRFGAVSYRIISHVDKGFIQAEIDPPAGNENAGIVLRLRHPDGKVMKSVTVNGKHYENYNKEKEFITLPPSKGRIVVRADYGR